LFLSIKVQSGQSYKTFHFLQEIVSDPGAFVENAVVKTVKIDGVEIPVWGETPNMLFWKL
jgi:hypothetical protein